MRVTISNQGSGKMQVGVDGLFYSDLNAEQLAPNVHAVQWYETHGEVEYKNVDTGRITANVEITNLDDFEFAVSAWQVFHAEVLATAAAKAEQEALAQAQASEEADTHDGAEALQQPLNGG
jgi:hypothetical protein